jgi:hypothetical protein
MASPDPPASTVAGHPIFARVYARISPAMDAHGALEHRRTSSPAWPGRVWRSAPATAVTSVTTPAVTEVLAVELESRALRITGGGNRTPYLRQP